MGLQCFLFSADQEASGKIRQVLADLNVEVESCPDAVQAVDYIAKQPVQIIVIDWDKQPEAGLLLGTARDRKASQRPLSLAIVSDDASVPKALQAGANSVLRKPISASQAADTLKTACDLLRAQRDTASHSSLPPLAPLAPPRALDQGKERTLRAGDFLQSATTAPSASFETEKDTAHSFETPSEQVDPLKNLEPVAAAVTRDKREPDPLPAPGETRGLQWYLKARGVTPPPPPHTPVQPPPANKPELVGFDQSPSFSGSAAVPKVQTPAPTPEQSAHQEKRKEAELFAYIDGGTGDESRPRLRLGKRAIAAALVLAGCAVAAAPQAPWHLQIRSLWSKGQHKVHAWLNPQPVIPVQQAPITHETFARAGDEYKLPVAEAIPDATTDPSQIQVLPVVDPTAKKPNPDATPADPNSVQVVDGSTTPSDQPQPAGQPSAQPATTSAPVQQPVTTATAPPPMSNNSPAVVPVAQPAANVPQILKSSGPAEVPSKPSPAVVKNPQPQYTAPGNIPSSLRSQMAPNSPDPVGPKMPGPGPASIEPVAVQEYAVRALIAQQTPIPYPASAKGQSGTVVVQVLIARDGSVKDAKFLQGSFVFAETATNAVREWKFKPYILNGRPVSVQTLLTLTFKPAGH